MYITHEGPHMTTTLTKGGNAPLPFGTCRVTLTSGTTGIDVSAVLLKQDGKVRGTTISSSTTIRFRTGLP